MRPGTAEECWRDEITDKNVIRSFQGNVNKANTLTPSEENNYRNNRREESQRKKTPFRLHETDWCLGCPGTTLFQVVFYN